jgi:V/A-type H+/Na+-transporting ATPase subunit D
MAEKFQYNKISMQNMKKQLQIRERALPTLQAKEAALRVEVKKAKAIAVDFRQQLTRREEEQEPLRRLWNEFPDILRIDDVKLSIKKIAGVQTPVIEDIVFKLDGFSLFNAPAWLLQGIELLKENVRLSLEAVIAERKAELLDHARRKTTQKVNLYERVQIPGYKEAITKIKRFLEDVENLSKSSQKMLKQRMAKAG